MRQQRVQGQPPQGHEVNIRPTNRMRRQRPSLISNSSSISSYSPPWVMTHRPQSQSTSWPTDYDILSSEPSVSLNGTASSTWQEEAHWMSFRNAVHYFASKTLQDSEPSSPLDDSKRTSTSETSHRRQSREGSPPVREIIGLTYYDDATHHGHADDAINRDHASRSTPGAPGTSEKEIVAKNSDKTAGHSDEQVKSLASELAETKMRLALVQAERDELEFALLIGGVSESRSLSGGS